MTLQDTLKKWIGETLELTATEDGVGFAVDFTVEHPQNMAFGDYSTNVAMVCAKSAHKNPIALADEFAEKLRAKKLQEVETITAVKPGFVNFTLKPEVFREVVEKIGEMGVHFGDHTRLSGQRMIVEYTQPNPFKEFHIGHMMNNAIGESVSRILEAHGTEVIRATYHGDVSMGIAKAVWGLQSMETGTDMTVHEMGQAYALGAKMFEENEEVKKEITAINKKIYERTDDAVNALYDAGRQTSLDYFEKMYARLGSHFDFHFFESVAGLIGKNIVLEFLEKGVFEKSDGAVVFRGEQYGLHIRVFINSEGIPTYEAKEIGLMQIKKDTCGPFDLSVTVTDNEQDGFFNVVEKAEGFVFPELAGHVLHLSHGKLKLPTGKMSSRTGSVVTAEAMIDQVKEVANIKMNARALSEVEKDATAEMVALGALKFTILRQAIGGDIIFDLEQALSLEGDSGPYLQYSTVRAKTLVRKACDVVTASSELPADWHTTNLERLLQRYPQVVMRAGLDYAPHHIVTYLLELASEFNSFYNTGKIVDPENPHAPYKLAVTQAFVNVMTAGLTLLGIAVPVEM